MSGYRGLGLEFDESMSGWLSEGATDPVEGRVRGERDGTPIRIDATIKIADLHTFLNITDHSAGLVGSVTFDPLGGKRPIEDGVFNLFGVDPLTGFRNMTYAFRFSDASGKRYFFHGHKVVKDDPGFDPLEDMTTLFTFIYEGEGREAPLYGAGQLFFKLLDAPALAASMRVTGDAWWGQELAAKVAFISFAYGALRDEYLRQLMLDYNTSYENLVLSGSGSFSGGAPAKFFLVSGAHEKGFPWGDGETFWDVLLAVRGPDGTYERYCISDRVLTGMALSVEGGTYRYSGPIFRIADGYAASFTEFHAGATKLIPCQAEFEISFNAKPYATTPLPFRIFGDLLDKLSYSLARILRELLPSESLFGIHITPHTVQVTSGRFTVSAGGESKTLTVDPAATFGEAEQSTFRNVKEPTMLYGYICGVQPEAKQARVQIHANSLRNDREYWGKDRLDAFLGAVVSHLTSHEMLMANGELTITDLIPEYRHPKPGTLFEKIGDPIIEVNNDHYPTAVFQRRIIAVRDPSGEQCLALEEDMDTLWLKKGPIDTDRTVTVASIRDPDKIKALDRVLDEAAFWEVLDARWKDSGKPKESFSIIIKPNFMFAYNKVDHSTYTDPELVAHLVKRLRAPEPGFSNISVVEAQSTYGQFFDKRSVREVAEYLDYSVDESAGYKLVDLTLDNRTSEHLGTHLGYHPVPDTWRNADFRISFAKNKTHAYAFYTLTLKDVYGALALPNKFKEYHCVRDIYHTTIDYLQAFPMHFGIIDAHTSADGPFGIFADSEPNLTQTVIGGADLVAVDWVGSAKMGLDPKISKYMDLAIRAFGKPGINLIGDAGIYRPWLNVPLVLTLFTHFGLDSNYYFGNLLYMAGAYMDEKQFTHKSKSAFMRAAREILKPLQKAVFLQAGGERTVANRLLGKFFTWLGT
jgi:uncharacterized protein (DUF362 family)